MDLLIMQLDLIIEKIINSASFNKLKLVIENNAYHDHESVFDHLIKTKEIAEREITGEFIKDPEVKRLFESFLEEKVGEFSKKELLILTAILHDVGKILRIKDGEETKPLGMTLANDQTYFPGHEYWGSKIISEILAEFNLEKSVLEFVAKIIKIHDVYSEEFFRKREDLEMDLLINDVKAFGQGIHLEVLFVRFCDCYNAEPFKEAKAKIVELFNNPDLYKKREYLTKEF